MINKYTKKPVEIEALQFNGNNFEEVENFTISGDLYYKENGDMFVATLEGEHKVSVGDFIIKGVKGEFYPCKPDIFEMTYEKVEQ